MADHPVTIQGPIAAGDTITVTVAATPSPPPPPPPIVIPFQGFAKADAAVSAGGTVDVPAGVYKEQFSLTKPGVTWRLATGAVIDLGGFAIPNQQAGWAAIGKDITVQGGRTTGSSASGWRAEGANFQLIDHETDNCKQQGFVGHSLSALIKGGSIHDCNPNATYIPPGEEGAGKLIAPHWVFDGVSVYRIGKGVTPTSPSAPSGGQGIWSDSVRLTNNYPPAIYGQGWDLTVRNCLLDDIFYAALMFEIGVGLRLQKSIITNSGKTVSGSGFWGAGALLSAATDAEITDNVFFGNQSNIRVVGWYRSDGPRAAAGGAYLETRNVHVLDNVLMDPTLDQISFHAEDDAIQARLLAAAAGNTIAGNRLHGKLSVQWGDGRLTSLAAINALPGGGGNALMSDTDAAKITAALPSKNVASILAAAGIAA